MWSRASDGTIVAKDGRIIWFSAKKFVSDICIGDHCMICGASRTETPFNDEHVLPKWILRRYNLFAKRINLPNGHFARYDQYTLPCCVKCNQLMSSEIEAPISKLVKRGFAALRTYLEKNGQLKIFVWLTLIFLKTHLKDRTLRLHLDHRKGSQKIADRYDWGPLHHIHTVGRCFFSGSAIATNAMGSFVMLPAKRRRGDDAFDFIDLYDAQTMLLRLGGVAFIAVFNDAGLALSYIHRMLNRITGPLSVVQLREVMVEMASLNLQLKTRPKFASLFHREKEQALIGVDLKSRDLRKWDRRLKGRLLHYSLQKVQPPIRVSGYTKKEADKAIKAGKLTFLFDDDGNFIKQDVRESLNGRSS